MFRNSRSDLDILELKKKNILEWYCTLGYTELPIPASTSYLHLVEYHRSELVPEKPLQ